MIIIDATDTSLTVQCVICETQYTVAISGLEAGTDASPDMIKLPVCEGDPNHQGYVCRTWTNAKVQAGIVNGLHAQLVTADQINTNQVATLEAETEDDVPPFAYTLSATAIENTLGVNGEYAHDLDAVLQLNGVDVTKQLVMLGILYPDRSSDDVSTWINSLWSETGERDRGFGLLEYNRAKAELP